VLFEQASRFGVDRLASDTDAGRGAEVIEDTLAPATPAGFDQGGRLVPAAVAVGPELRQGYFLFLLLV
jgi:hypothetical protein